MLAPADRAAAVPMAPPTHGLYMYGGVGTGKTMLMDLFVESAPSSFKVRIPAHVCNTQQQQEQQPDEHPAVSNQTSVSWSSCCLFACIAQMTCVSRQAAHLHYEFLSLRANGGASKSASARQVYPHVCSSRLAGRSTDIRSTLSGCLIVQENAKILPPARWCSFWGLPLLTWGILCLRCSQLKTVKAAGSHIVDR